MTTNITDIFKIFENSSENNNQIESNSNKYTNDKESFLDFENSIDNRVESFLKIYQKDNLEAYELITDLCSMYNFSPIESIYLLIERILNLEYLELNIRFPLLSTIYYKEKEIEKIEEENKKFGNKKKLNPKSNKKSKRKNESKKSPNSLKLFINVLESCYKNHSIFNSTIFLDILKFILNNEFKDFHSFDISIYNILEFLVTNKINSQNIIDNNIVIKKNLEYNDYIYRYFHSLIKDDNYNKNFINTGLKISYKNSYDKLKILIITYFLTYSKNFTTDDLKFYIKEDRLILKNIIDYKSLFIEDLSYIFYNNEDYNTKSDSADLLLKFDTEETIKLGRDYLDKLTSEKGKRLFYENEQNVHKFEINDNVIEFIKYISSSNDLTINKNKEEDYYKMCEDELIKEITTNYNDVNLINVQKSLNRIYMDSFRYKGYTLTNIFIKIWFIIRKHNNRNSLLKRLLEELEDMHDTCSSGHILRLINVFSGFGFNLKMGVELEIKNKLYHIINKKLENEDEDLILEMTNKEEINKFSLYFMKNMDEIYNEMWNEYKDILNQDDFKEIFRTQTMLL